MTKALDLAVKKVRKLAPERQNDAAALLLTLVEQEESDYRLTPEQEAQVAKAIEEADAGRFASEDEMRRLFKKFGL